MKQHETSIRVMNMVRRTLFESPDVPDRVLYAAAVSLEPAVGDLTLQQFQARYPRHVRRFELGPRPGRGTASDAGPTRHAVADGPDLYAPGKDTLIGQAPPAEDPRPPEVVADQQGSLPVAAFPRVRRRAGKPATEPGPVETPRQKSAGLQPEDESAGADSSRAPDAGPRRPWPLRLLPATAVREPPKRPRTRSASPTSPDLRLESARDVSDQLHASAPAAAQPQSSAPADGNGAKAAVSTAGIDSRPPASSSEAVLGEDQRIVLRDEIRRLLFDWARALATAETRGELVGVLARAGDYVDSISNAWTAAVEATGTLKDRESRRRTGSADRGSADSTRPTAPARPALRPGKRIQDYDAGELDALAQWVISNDPDRTDHAVIDVLCSELGFKRRGRRINAQLQSSVERVRGGRAL